MKKSTIVICLILANILLISNMSAQFIPHNSSDGNDDPTGGSDETIKDFDQRFAVIIVGTYGTENQEPPRSQYYYWYTNCANTFYNKLTSKYNFDPNNIYVLATLVDEYQDNLMMDLDRIYTDATEENIQSVLNMFKSGGTHPLNSDDLLVIEVISHGMDLGWWYGNQIDLWPNGHDTYFGLESEKQGGDPDPETKGEEDLNGDQKEAPENNDNQMEDKYPILNGMNVSGPFANKVFDHEFGSYLNGIDAGRVITILQPCFSGGFINDLSGYNRVTMTASREDEPAGDFLGPLHDAIDGNPDFNGDGRTSFSEIFEKTSENVDNARQSDPDGNPHHPLLDDSNDFLGRGHQYDESGYNPCDSDKDGYISFRIFDFEYEVTNFPPNKPVPPQGPSMGTVGISYTYYTYTHDLDDTDQLYFKFSWGDGTDSGWIGPYNSNEQVTRSHAWNTSGAYRVKVKAKDTKNAESAWSVSRFVNIVDDQPPVADVGGPYNGNEDEQVTFDGSNSYDVDGTIVYYHWNFGDGNSKGGTSLKCPKHTYNNGGTYTVTLTVTDDVGITDIDTTTVNINKAPVVYIHVWGPLGFRIGGSINGQASGTINKDYTFKAYGILGNTLDPDGSIVAYKWSRETGSTCFLAGTKISMADRATKNIEDIKVGDKVIAFDEATNKNVVSKVIDVFHHAVDEMNEYYLIINGRLHVTPEHKIFVNNEWKEAAKIKTGDVLQQINGEEIIVHSIKKVFDRVPTYNFEVETYHTYYANDILVHNAKGSVQYYWAYGSTIADKTWSWSETGDYEVKLEVKDNDGAISEATVLMQMSSSGNSD